MPTKYTDRINLPIDGMKEIEFFTKNGLKIATGYEKIVINKVPFIRLSKKQLVNDNIRVLENQKWRIKNPNSPYVEYRSRDYCAVKIIQTKNDKKFYISPFELKSNTIPVLISPRFKV